MAENLSQFLSGGNKDTLTAEFSAGAFSVASTGTKINAAPTYDVQYFTLILESYNATSSNARITITVGGRVVVSNARIMDLLWVGRTHPLTVVGGKGETITVTCNTANGGQSVNYTLIRGAYR